MSESIIDEFGQKYSKKFDKFVQIAVKIDHGVTNKKIERKCSNTETVNLKGKFEKIRYQN